MIKSLGHSVQVMRITYGRAPHGFSWNWRAFGKVRRMSQPEMWSKAAATSLIEMISEEFGGRVELAKAYYKALTASVRKHFKGNGTLPACSSVTTLCSSAQRLYHLAA
ncbi:hypothetical protein LguiA_028083 [Lonicera macranthoides]